MATAPIGAPSSLYRWHQSKPRRVPWRSGVRPALKGNAVDCRAARTDIRYRRGQLRGLEGLLSFDSVHWPPRYLPLACCQPTARRRPRSQLSLGRRPSISTAALFNGERGSGPPLAPIPQRCVTMALLVFVLTRRVARGRRQNRARYALSRLRGNARRSSLWPHAWKPATVMPQVGVPFAPEALAVV